MNQIRIPYRLIYFIFSIFYNEIFHFFSQLLLGLFLSILGRRIRDSKGSRSVIAGGSLVLTRSHSFHRLSNVYISISWLSSPFDNFLGHHLMNCSFDVLFAIGWSFVRDHWVGYNDWVLYGRAYVLIESHRWFYLCVFLLGFQKCSILVTLVRLGL